jgi:hypothetical protein
MTSVKYQCYGEAMATGVGAWLALLFMGWCLLRNCLHLRKVGPRSFDLQQKDWNSGTSVCQSATCTRLEQVHIAGKEKSKHSVETVLHCP